MARNDTVFHNSLRKHMLRDSPVAPFAACVATDCGVFEHRASRCATTACRGRTSRSATPQVYTTKSFEVGTPADFCNFFLQIAGTSLSARPCSTPNAQNRFNRTHTEARRSRRRTLRKAEGTNGRMWKICGSKGCSFRRFRSFRCSPTSAACPPKLQRRWVRSLPMKADFAMLRRVEATGG